MKLSVGEILVALGLMMQCGFAFAQDSQPPSQGSVKDNPFFMIMKDYISQLNGKRIQTSWVVDQNSDFERRWSVTNDSSFGKARGEMFLSPKEGVRLQAKADVGHVDVGIDPQGKSTILFTPNPNRKGEKPLFPNALVKRVSEGLFGFSDCFWPARVLLKVQNNFYEEYGDIKESADGKLEITTAGPLPKTLFFSDDGGFQLHGIQYDHNVDGYRTIVKAEFSNSKVEGIWLPVKSTVTFDVTCTGKEPPGWQDIHRHTVWEARGTPKIVPDNSSGSLAWDITIPPNATLYNAFTNERIEPNRSNLVDQANVEYLSKTAKEEHDKVKGDLPSLPSEGSYENSLAGSLAYWGLGVLGLVCLVLFMSRRRLWGK